jgi:hypothetical protein
MGAPVHMGIGKISSAGKSDILEIRSGGKEAQAEARFPIEFRRSEPRVVMKFGFFETGIVIEAA